MEIHIKQTNIVRPAQETPNHCLWNSNFELLIAHRAHVPLVYFYRPASDRSNLFEACVLKEALSKALVAFYPLAGRLTKDENGRLEINCNAEGALFVEAETSCVIDDEFGYDDFSPSLKMKQLIPTVLRTTDLSSSPLLALQVTYFKCGGVCLGLGWHQILGDGTSAFQFMNSLAEITRGLSVSISPLIDRTVLRTRIPPYSTFNHIECHPSPSMNIKEIQSNFLSTNARLKLSLDQIKTLKAKIKKDHGAIYTTYEILAAHIWHCTCKERGLLDDPATKLYIPINGRPRLNPPLPNEYFGNIICYAASIALAGDIQSKPLIYTLKIIHEALKQVDDEYVRSSLAYLGQHDHDHDPTALKKVAPCFNCPNLQIMSWLRMLTYDTDSGLGKPIYMGRAIIPHEGESYILPSPSNGRNLSLILCLETHHMQLFKKLFYSMEAGPLKKYYRPSSL